uniref:Peptidase M1 leukotriene A4 hydrolase/aminopeptidase C-terminal domain-containing protein n=1 Tax=Glossina morsitans morsitans TaxID=37546 RepID=A0A1B0G0X7_GLOMM
YSRALLYSKANLSAKFPLPEQVQVQAAQKRTAGLGKIDPTSYAEPELVTTLHSVLNWKVDFEKKYLKGSVMHHFKALQKDLPAILLDVRNMKILKVELVGEKANIPLKHRISDPAGDMGAKLTLELPEDTNTADLYVNIDYETSNNASALQWLAPEQTLGKKHPFMFSQCWAIHARSILPCQDTPAVKFTYRATVEHPEELTALMSATVLKRENSRTTFVQDVPIPSYLLAIAIGKLVSKPLGRQSNVWAEEDIIDECAEEFSDTLDILKVATDISGHFVWKHCDLLVMPPSFPFGGMENPCLIFVTPTLLAGDKSLSNVIAHEIAHSWAGNLVTNKNFEHFWLNEGIAAFLESKIIGRMRGNKERDFHMLRNLSELKECIQTQLADRPELTKLVVDLSNCTPDEAYSSVPYIKGSIFLRYMEDLLGGSEIFERFLRQYWQRNAYNSVSSEDFKQALCEFFSKTNRRQKLSLINWDLWLNGEGMPPTIPRLDQSLASVSKRLALFWATKTVVELNNSPQLKEQISVHQLIDMLGKIVESPGMKGLNDQKIELLETTYNLKETKNVEIRFHLMRLYIMAKSMGRLDEIFNFLNSNFRLKYIRPIYRDLVNWPAAKPKAIENFKRVKGQMMAICSHAIEKDLGFK